MNEYDIISVKNLWLSASAIVLVTFTRGK